MSSKAIDLEGWDIAKPRPYGYLCNLRMCSDCRCDGTNHIQNEIFETPEFAYAAANVQFSQRNLGVSKSNFKEQRNKRKLQMSRCDEETGRANDELTAQQILEQDGIDPDEITAAIRLIMHSLSPAFREIAFYSFSGLSSAEIAERSDTGIDVEYIIDQIGLLTIEVQRSNPNVALLLKCIDRIGEISPVIAKILEPISCGRLEAAAVT